MKSEKCKLNGTPACAEIALNETERFAHVCGLPPKKALHLRLLAEEMLGMMNGLLSVRDGEFWVEQGKEGYEIHAQARTKNLTESAAARLMEASTSGENDCYKGVSGKICRALDWLITRQPDEDDDPVVFDAHSQKVLMEDPYAQKMSEALAASGTVQWSFSQYIASENPDLKAEQWDELERSVLSNLADDIRIGVRDRDVFVTVCWNDDEVWSMLKKLKKQMKN
ncbi:hypothetical protein [Gemmiger sp.]